MPYRSFDFERIYNNFLETYGNEGEQAYYTWLNGLRLDESKEYGQARESYRWKKEDLQFVREDADAKYYEIEVGFPTKSMNGNVYREHDLVAAASTLKGKHPSLNHKNEFWFSPKNPRNRWGNIEILDGKFHEGICKALVRVPKTTICPICNGKPMTELIDNKRIINVSLEGDCLNGQCYDGTCEGFYFTDPPFTFLTTDVLPGIPMTRIKPLESYLPVSQSSSNIEERKNKIVKIKPRIIEDTNQNSNQPPVNVNTKSIVTDLRGDIGTPINNDNIHSQTQSSGNVTVPVGTSAGTYQMKSGYGEATKPPPIPRTAEALAEPFADYTDFNDCVSKNSDKDDPEAYCASIKQQTESKRREEAEPDRSTDAPTTLPSTSEPDRDVDAPATGPPKTKPETESPEATQPAGAPTVLPTVTKPVTDTGSEPPKADDKVVMGDSPSEMADCAPGYHKDENGNCVPDASPLEQEGCADGYHKDASGMCVPDEPLDEQVKRFKAETREFLATAETQRVREQMKGIENYYVKKYSSLNEAYRKALAFNQTQDKVNRQLREQVRAEQLRCEDLRVEVREIKNQMADQVRTGSKQAHLVEDLKIENAELNRKYNGALATNLKLSKDVTRANEEYLDLAHVKEKLEDDLKKARVLSKKILKLKA